MNRIQSDLRLRFLLTWAISEKLNSFKTIEEVIFSLKNVLDDISKALGHGTDMVTTESGVSLFPQESREWLWSAIKEAISRVSEVRIIQCFGFGDDGAVGGENVIALKADVENRRNRKAP
jgi:hypothetical protein